MDEKKVQLNCPAQTKKFRCTLWLDKSYLWLLRIMSVFIETNHKYYTFFDIFDSRNYHGWIGNYSFFTQIILRKGQAFDWDLGERN